MLGVRQCDIGDLRFPSTPAGCSTLPLSPSSLWQHTTFWLCPSACMHAPTQCTTLLGLLQLLCHKDPDALSFGSNPHS